MYYRWLKYQPIDPKRAPCADRIINIIWYMDTSPTADFRTSSNGNTILSYLYHDSSTGTMS